MPRSPLHRNPRPLSLAPLALAPLTLWVLTACSEPTAPGPDPLALSAAAVEAQALASVPPAELTPSAELVLPEAALPEEVPASPLVLPPTIEITVRHGETLVVLAGQAGCLAEELATLNGLDVSGSLRPGQPLLLPVDRVDGETLRSKRDEALAARLDRYLRARGGVAGVRTHRVRTGETAWAIARDGADLPTWVLAAYNPDVDLDRLRIGDSLQVPVLAELVAEADSTEPGPPAP